jgi:hypothetical protein
MLGDTTRVDAYDTALAGALRPGDVVVDVGCGALPLSLLALDHGAGRVYAIEADPAMSAIASELVRANNLQDRLIVVHGDARLVRLPEKADLVVSEMIGNIGPEEQMPEILGLVARRVLRPQGRMLPSRLTTHLRAIEFDGEGWGVWTDFRGYALDAVQQYASPLPQPHVFVRPPKTLSEPVAFDDAQLQSGTRTTRRDVTLEITRPGKLQAAVGYFTAHLGPGIELSNFPGYPGCNWAVVAWPLRHTEVGPGDALRIRLESSKETREIGNWRLHCDLARSQRRKSHEVRGRLGT